VSATTITTWKRRKSEGEIRRAENRRQQHKHGFTFKAISHGCAPNLCRKFRNDNKHTGSI